MGASNGTNGASNGSASASAGRKGVRPKVLLVALLAAASAASYAKMLEELRNVTRQENWVPALYSRNKTLDKVRNITRQKNRAPLARRNKGLHVCTCLNDEHPQNIHLPDAPKRIRWLHIPKTGTSFITTLWSYAASTSERYIDLSFNSHVCGKHLETDVMKPLQYDNFSHSMYGHALMRRYPWEMYGAQNMIPKGTRLDKDMKLGLVGGTQHEALTPSLNDGTSTNSRWFHKMRHKLQSRRWGSELFDHNFTVATFFRKPEDRIVSAYYDGMHSNGFHSEARKDLIQSIHVNPKMYRNPLECFARYPGIAGCMARMLTGQTCADGILHEAGLENLPMAIDIILNHLDFVGIMEEWNESVCQFHRLYTGKVDPKTGKRMWDHPLQGEFANVHKYSERKTLNVQHLNGFMDVADMVVYEAAKFKFQRMVGDDRCYKYVPMDEVRRRKRENVKDLPFVAVDDQGEVCEPQTCSDLQKQCGEWPDGCGRTIICGMCNPGRTALPATWRVRCTSEGQCVDYCPTWDDKGHWFLSEESLPVLKHVSSRGQKGEMPPKHLSPVDAVQICVEACNNPKQDDRKASEDSSSSSGLDQFVNTGLCRCGVHPRLLLSDLTATDYADAHDMNAMCRDSRARRLGYLHVNETQPVCCPEVSYKHIPDGWRRQYVMDRPPRNNNFEGEYFDQVYLGCGAFVECEALGKERKAEMVVYDMMNSYCYLMRNVVDLGDAYTVTKDNEYRFVRNFRSPEPSQKVRNSALGKPGLPRVGRKRVSKGAP